MKAAGVMLAFAGAAQAADLDRTDLARAYMPKPLPTSHVVGSDGNEIFENMNNFLVKQPHHTQPCEEYTHQELNDLARMLYTFRDTRLAEIYDDAEDNRKFHFDDLTYKEKLWAQEHILTTTEPEEHGVGSENYDMRRDGKCAELVMWWIHHLPQQARTKLSGVEGFKVPLLPVHGLRVTENKEYIYQVTCAACHSTGKPLAPVGTAETAGVVQKRSKESVAAVPAGTCPLDPKTLKPTVWYQPMSDVGNRLKRCDWDYDPPCQLCEGVGGYSWGDGENDITYTSCTPVMNASQIPINNRTNPVWPIAFTVDEVTVLINQISEGGRFPGADPCAVHNFKNDTEKFYYDGTKPVMYTKTTKSDIWTLPTADMFIKIMNVFCICVTPVENGNHSATPTGPLYHDFAKDAVLVGREIIGLEGLGQKVLADHWNKGPHHFWMSVETNLMVRGWQPWNGLNVYKNWQIATPDAQFFEVPKSCYSGFLHKNISCVHSYP